MNRPGLAVLPLFLFLVCPGCFSQESDYYDLDPYTIAAEEKEALTYALDDVGLDLDSPELEGMDEGEIWGYIEYMRKEQTTVCLPLYNSSAIVTTK